MLTATSYSEGEVTSYGAFTYVSPTDWRVDRYESVSYYTGSPVEQELDYRWKVCP